MGPRTREVYSAKTAGGSQDASPLSQYLRESDPHLIELIFDGAFAATEPSGDLANSQPLVVAKEVQDLKPFREGLNGETHDEALLKRVTGDGRIEKNGGTGLPTPVAVEQCIPADGIDPGTLG